MLSGHLIVIYPVDSVIKPLNNRGQTDSNAPNKYYKKYAEWSKENLFRFGLYLWIYMCYLGVKGS